MHPRQTQAGAQVAGRQNSGGGRHCAAGAGRHPGKNGGNGGGTVSPRNGSAGPGNGEMHGGIWQAVKRQAGGGKTQASSR